MHLDKKQMTERLQSIVKEFNEFFATWQKENDAVANFGWKYNDGLKALEVQSIDIIVYRVPPPGAQAFQEVMKQAETAEARKKWRQDAAKEVPCPTAQSGEEILTGPPSEKDKTRP